MKLLLIKKLAANPLHLPLETEENSPSGYYLIDISLLGNDFGELCCPTCKLQKVKFCKINKSGFAIQYCVSCCDGACAYENFFWSSEKNKERSFDINKRIIYAMRRIGNGNRGIKLFESLMDMPPPMSNSQSGEGCRLKHNEGSSR